MDHTGAEHLGVGTGYDVDCDRRPGLRCDRVFVIVGRSTDHEGSAGRDGLGAERPEPSSSLQCWLPRLLGDPCP